jgi:hypothetical protein
MAGQHTDGLGEGPASSPSTGFRGSHWASSRRGVLARLRERFKAPWDGASAGLPGSELSFRVRTHDEPPLIGRVLTEPDDDAGQRVEPDGEPDGEREAWQQVTLDGRPLGRWLGLGLGFGQDRRGR